MGIRHNHKGFTLIELLIVVAIIAILAAIAIPNFLAAQTRAKVSRSKSEMRSVATALESYVVDYNVYPSAYHARGGFSLGWLTPDFMCPYQIRLIPITTPVAYLTSLPRDPFNPLSDRSGSDWSDDGNNTYVYFTSYPSDVSHLYSNGVFTSPSWMDVNPSGKWRLAGYGPARKRYFSSNDFLREGEMGYTDYEYDPSNGTVSNGMITRVGP
jgi:prepilin-type N-terminal cleavage/methylation domain-containing protein